MLPRVVLYNPKAVFWTMPLALIAVGSALARSEWDVRIVDGRFEADPTARLLSLLGDDAVCLGVSVLTGTPIRDALEVSRAVKRSRPRLPIVWGGWHPSLFPEQVVRAGAADAVVVGQGEETFNEIVLRLSTGRSLEGVAGCVGRLGRDSALHDSASLQAPRPFRDVNSLPAHDYDLIDVPRYFRAKGIPQFDYISSQGCRFRCSFCADPTMYERNWSGLLPERIAEELGTHRRRYRFKSVSFQDETFFTSRSRVDAIAEAFLCRDLRVEWTATMRSDQGCRLGDDLFAKCRRAGLRRVMIGIESGSPEMLKRIQKDTTLSQVLECADKCRRFGIGAILNFIVGFPDESDESIRQTLDLAARLRAISPDFEASIFYFKPYPGNALAEELQHSGHPMPATLEGWADFDYVSTPPAWIRPGQRRLIESFKFYQRHAFGPRRSWPRRSLQLVSRWRVAGNHYGLPVEKMLLERLRPAPRLS